MMQPRLLLAITMPLLFATYSLAEVPIVDTWKYTIREPGDGWEKANYDDGRWKEGAGGFGTPDTPSARVATRWQTKNIWLRKRFKLDAVPDKPALLIHHDEDATVFINGRQVAALTGYSTDYEVVPIGVD